jgi:hypothetical protein
MPGEKKVIAGVATIFEGGGGGKVDLPGGKKGIELGRHTGTDLTAKAALPQIMKEGDAVSVGDVTDAQRHQLAAPLAKKGVADDSLMKRILS